VEKVVTGAMSTSMVNIVGKVTPRSIPQLSTMSSMRLRVFMKLSVALASRHRSPVIRAGMALAPNFPSRSAPEHQSGYQPL
jgi:hypothetical protein